MPIPAIKRYTVAITFGIALAASIGRPASAQTVVEVRPPPPPLRVESVPAARPGYAWARGHWQWVRGGYAWVPGHWRSAGPVCPPGMHPGPHGRRCF